MRRSKTLLGAVALGYAFLYAPLILVIAYSFNAAPTTTAWTGLSLCWYDSLFHNERLIRAIWVSLKVASLSATLSMVLGSLAAIALVRVRTFRGKFFFRGFLNIPLVMPDILTGLALLLLFINVHKVFSFTQQGITTLTLAHTTLGLAYVAAIVKARLQDQDQSIEEAAQDLGARPSKVFFLITLPNLMPALVSGWLLAFALSLDDVVVASFVAVPGATTLPMVVFSSIRLGVSPEINALAAVMILLVALCVSLAAFVIYRRRVS